MRILPPCPLTRCTEVWESKSAEASIVFHMNEWQKNTSRNMDFKHPKSWFPFNMTLICFDVSSVCVNSNKLIYEAAWTHGLLRLFKDAYDRFALPAYKKTLKMLGIVHARMYGCSWMCRCPQWWFTYIDINNYSPGALLKRFKMMSNSKQTCLSDISITRYP